MLVFQVTFSHCIKILSLPYQRCTPTHCRSCRVVKHNGLLIATECWLAIAFILFDGPFRVRRTLSPWQIRVQLEHEQILLCMEAELESKSSSSRVQANRQAHRQAKGTVGKRENEVRQAYDSPSAPIHAPIVLDSASSFHGSSCIPRLKSSIFQTCLSDCPFSYSHSCPIEHPIEHSIEHPIEYPIEHPSGCPSSHLLGTTSAERVVCREGASTQKRVK